ncbi:MAG: hypothetical protein AABY13_01060, partial [Nanoarchaeota archaeon]
MTLDQRLALTSAQLADATLLQRIGNLVQLNPAAVNGAMQQVLGLPAGSFTFVVDPSLAARVPPGSVTYVDGYLFNSAFQCEQGRGCGLNLKELAANAGGQNLFITATGDIIKGQEFNGFVICAGGFGAQCKSILAQDAVLSSIKTNPDGSLSLQAVDGNNVDLVKGGVNAIKDSEGNIHFLIVDGTQVKYQGITITSAQKGGEIDIRFEANELRVLGPATFASDRTVTDSTGKQVPAITGMTSLTADDLLPHVKITFGPDGQPSRINLDGKGQFQVRTQTDVGYLEEQITNYFTLNFGRTPTGLVTTADFVLRGTDSAYERETAIGAFGRRDANKGLNTGEIIRVKPRVGSDGKIIEPIHVYIQDGKGSALLDARAAAISDILKIQQGLSGYKQSALDAIKNSGQTELSAYVIENNKLTEKKVTITNAAELDTFLADYFHPEAQQKLLQKINSDPGDDGRPETRAFFSFETNVKTGKLTVGDFAVTGVGEFTLPDRRIVTTDTSANAFFRNSADATNLQFYLRSANPLTAAGQKSLGFVEATTSRPFKDGSGKTIGTAYILNEKAYGIVFDKDGIAREIYDTNGVRLDATAEQDALRSLGSAHQITKVWEYTETNDGKNDVFKVQLTKDSILAKGLVYEDGRQNPRFSNAGEPQRITAYFFDSEGSGRPNVVRDNNDVTDIILAGFSGAFGDRWNVAVQPIDAARIETLSRSIQTERIVATKGIQGLIAEVRRIYGENADRELAKYHIEVHEDGTVIYNNLKVGEGIAGLVTPEAIGPGGAPRPTIISGVLEQVAADAKLGNVPLLIDAARKEAANDHAAAIHAYQLYIQGGGSKSYAASQIYAQYKADNKQADGLLAIQSLAADPSLSLSDKVALLSLTGTALADAKRYGDIEGILQQLEQLKQTPRITPEFIKYLDQKIGDITKERLAAQASDATLNQEQRLQAAASLAKVDAKAAASAYASIFDPNAPDYLQKVRSVLGSLSQADQDKTLAAAYQRAADNKALTADQRISYLEQSLAFAQKSGGQPTPELLKSLGLSYEQQGRYEDAYQKYRESQEAFGDRAAQQNFETRNGFSFANYFQEQNVLTEREFNVIQRTTTPNREQQLATLGATYLATTLRSAKDDIPISFRTAQAYANINDIAASRTLTSNVIATAQAALKTSTGDETKTLRQTIIQAATLQASNARAAGGADVYKNERAAYELALEQSVALGDKSQSDAIKARIDATWYQEATALKIQGKTAEAHDVLVEAAKNGYKRGLLSEAYAQLSSDNADKYAIINDLLQRSDLANAKELDVVQLQNAVTRSRLNDKLKELKTILASEGKEGQSEASAEMISLYDELEKRTRALPEAERLKLKEDIRLSLLTLFEAAVIQKHAATAEAVRDELRSQLGDAAKEDILLFNENIAQMRLDRIFERKVIDKEALTRFVEEYGATKAGKFAAPQLAIENANTELESITRVGEAKDFGKIKTFLASVEKELERTDLTENQRLQLESIARRARASTGDDLEIARGIVQQAKYRLEKASPEERVKAQQELDNSPQIAALYLLERGKYSDAKEFLFKDAAPG